MKRARCETVLGTFRSKSAHAFDYHISHQSEGAFVWDQSGIRIIGLIQVGVRLAALPIPEYLDFHSGYSGAE